MADVRQLFDDDLARNPGPPLGDLVEQSIAQGARLRRRRRWAMAGAGGSALALLVVAGLVAGPLTGGGAGRPAAAPGAGLAAGAAGATATAEPSATPKAPPYPVSADEQKRMRSGQPSGPEPRVIDHLRIPPRPGGAQRAATPAAVLELLTRLLPQGSVSGLARNQDGSLMVQAYLDRGAGPGMLRLAVYKNMPGGSSGRGTVRLLELPDNCIQDKLVMVDHGDVGVDILIASCLAWRAW